MLQIRLSNEIKEKPITIKIGTANTVISPSTEARAATISSSMVSLFYPSGFFGKTKLLVSTTGFQPSGERQAQEAKR
jgi:hypothetical protein